MSTASCFGLGGRRRRPLLVVFSSLLANREFMGSTGLRLNSSTPPHPTEVAEAEKAAEEKAKGLKDPVKFEKYHDGLGELGAVLYAIGCGRQLEPGQAVTQATQGATDMSPEDALKKDEKDQDSVVAQFKQQCQKTNRRRMESCHTYNCAAEMKDCEKACAGKFEKDNAFCVDHANQLRDLYKRSGALSAAKHQCVQDHCPNVGGQVLSSAARLGKDEKLDAAWKAKAAEEPCNGDAGCAEKCKVDNLFECTESAAQEYGGSTMFQFCVDMFHDWQTTEEVNPKTGHPALR